MEVHHHPHLEHKEKPWKEYLLEGLMIFLAVSMGFIAENIREHLAENNKKKELLEIVALDLERDIKQLDFHKDFAKKKMISCDSLLYLLDLNNNKVNEYDYYRQIFNVLSYWNFNSNNKSLIEADTKGYLSSSQNPELANLILKFNFFSNDYKSSEDKELKLMDKFSDELPFISDNEILNKYTSRLLKEERITSNHIGIKNAKMDDLVQSKFILIHLRNIGYGYLGDIDSMQVYAKKSIENIRHQKY